MTNRHFVRFDINTNTIKKMETEEFSYPLREFYENVCAHLGKFELHGRLYDNVLPTLTNLYFSSSEHSYDDMIIFDPIIDIKKVNNRFVIFYYNKQFTLTLLGD